MFPNRLKTDMEMDSYGRTTGTYPGQVNRQPATYIFMLKFRDLWQRSFQTTKI